MDVFVERTWMYSPRILEGRRRPMHAPSQKPTG